jgi:2-hydroxy-6-oxonona-2,4-dienedioate hydrolase
MLKHWLLLTAVAAIALAQMPTLPMKSVDVFGQKIRYHESGTGDRTVIFLHGLGGYADNWAMNAPAFASKYHVFVPDQIGFGSSDKPFLNYRVQTMVEFLDGFYRKINIERATLVGNSLGGWIAAAFALSHPDKVDRLVLVDSAGLSSSAGNTPREVLLGLNPSSVAGMRAVLNLILYNKAMITDAFVEQAFAGHMRNNDGYTINAFIDSVERKEDMLDGKLGLLKPPALIVWGAQDGLTPVALGNALHEGIRGSEMVTLDKCGHIPQAECSPRFNEAVLAWLEK